ncbi:MAG: OmpL47-type beta-barrel domain-containing protein [Armatimonadota bacterium]
MYRRLALLATLLITALAVPSQAQTLGTGTILQSGYGVNRIERVDDIDAHPDGGWVILDANHGLASKYRADGTFERIVATAEDMQAPGITPDIRSISVDRLGYVYAAGPSGIARFQPDGTFDRFLTDVELDVVDTAIDATGQLLVLTPTSLSVFSRAGNLAATITNIGNSGANPISDALGIAALPNGNVVLLHRQGHLSLLDNRYRQLRDISPEPALGNVRAFADGRIVASFTDFNLRQGYRFFTSGLDTLGEYIPADAPTTDSVFATAGSNRIGYQGTQLSRVVEANVDTSAIRSIHTIVDTQTPLEHGSNPVRILADGSIMVWNSRIGSLQRFDQQGMLLSDKSIGNDGIVFHADPSGRAFIRPQAAGGTVNVYAANGLPETTINVSPLSGFSTVNITAIGTDGAGDIYVYDADSVSIRRLSPTGSQKLAFRVNDASLSNELSDMRVTSDGHIYLLFAGGSTGHIDIYANDGLRTARRIGDDVTLRLYGQLDVASDGRVVFLSSDDYSGIGAVLSADLSSVMPLKSVLSPTAVFTTSTYFALDADGDIWVSAALSNRVFELMPIQDTPPRTEALVEQYPNGNSWFRTPVNVFLNGLDAERAWGVAGLYYQIDVLEPVIITGSTTVATLLTEGDHQLAYFATDNYGNDEYPKVINVRIDMTAPVTTASVRNGGTSAVLSATDNLSGIDSVWYVFDKQAPKKYTGAIALDGQAHSIRYWAVDKAGNEEARKLFTTSFAPVSVTLTPATTTGGVNVDGRIVLNGTAGVGGFKVNLTSTNVAAVVPASVTVAEGQSSVTFTVTTKAVAVDTSITITAAGGAGSITAKLLLQRTKVVGVTLNPATLAGGSASTATVTLSGAAPAGGAVVVLQSNKSAASVPGTVTIPAGQTSGTFSISTVAVSTDVLATISATYGGSTTGADLSITRVALAGFTLNRSSVVGGGTRIATVTLSGNAPSGGYVVSLSSESTAVSIPATVTIPSGQKSTSVSVTTSPVSDATGVVLHAVANGIEKVAVLDVLPPNVTIKVAPVALTGGNTATGTVSLDGKAPSGGLTVSLTSDDVHAVVPASVVVATGKTSATFSVSTTQVSGETQVEVAAAIGEQVSSCMVVLRPIGIKAVTFTPSTVRGGLSSQLQVTLDAPAPATGVTLDVYATNPAVSVGSSIVVASGQTTATLTVNTQVVFANVRVPVVVTSGASAVTGTLTVTGAEVMGLTLNPVSVTGGKPSTATLTISSAAPSTGYVVQLSSSLTGVATVPATVIVPSGKTSVTFVVTTLAVNAIRDVSISASLNGVSKSASLKLLPPAVASVTIAPTSVTGGTNATGTVKLAVAAPGDVTVTFSTSSALIGSVPATVTVTKGALSANFTVTTKKPSVQTVVTIGATSDGVTTKTGTLTVKP